MVATVIFLLVLAFSLSDPQCGQIPRTLVKALGKDLDRRVSESDTDGNGNRIINGKTAPTHCFHWQAQLHILNLMTKILGSCGGSVISNRFVLTAAHCASKEENFEVKEVWLGRHNLEFGGMLYHVAEVFVHPRREPSPKAHDMALLRMSQEITFGPDISAVCLPSSPLASPRAEKSPGSFCLQAIGPNNGCGKYVILNIA